MRRVVIAFFVYLVLDNTRRGCSIKAKLAGVERRASPVRRQDVSVRAVALNEGNWEFFSAHSFSLSLSRQPPIFGLNQRQICQYADARPTSA